MGFQSEKADSVTGNSLKEPVNKSLGAQSGAIDDERPPACAVWNANLDEIHNLAPDNFESFLGTLIPDADNGKTLTLIVPTRFLKEYNDKNYRQDLECILSRKIVIEVRTLTGRAASERALKQQGTFKRR